MQPSGLNRAAEIANPCAFAGSQGKGGMRTGLIAAQSRTAAGDLRAQLRLAGRSVLAWQVDLLRRVGAERIICLCDAATGDILPLQHQIEATGGSFHALKGFAALPALVRAEDELIVLCEGLVPDPDLMAAHLVHGGVLTKGVLCLPEDHPLAKAYPTTFERIDATRHWAGLLVMRGAPVQYLADFPADADAVSVLLRLALQAGTPCRGVPMQDVSAATWLFADDEAAARGHEAALIAAAAPAQDWRAPLSALAAGVVRIAGARWIGEGARASVALALTALIGGVISAAFGLGSIGLALAALGAFTAKISAGFSSMTARLRRCESDPFASRALEGAVDLSAALVLWFALSPWPGLAPLAICGPLTIGLARLAERDGRGVLSVIASDRASLLIVLVFAAIFGLVAPMIAALAAAVLAALLLYPRKN